MNESIKSYCLQDKKKIGVHTSIYILKYLPGILFKIVGA